MKKTIMTALCTLMMAPTMFGATAFAATGNATVKSSIQTEMYRPGRGGGAHRGGGGHRGGGWHHGGGWHRGGGWGWGAGPCRWVDAWGNCHWAPAETAPVGE